MRLFHWSAAGLIGLAWWTASHDDMALHKAVGCALAGLLVFRFWWGFAGGRTARFSSFVKGPASVARYARDLVRGRSAPAPPGHNPMGGWSVLALLALMSAIVGFGLFCVDVDGEESGPFADLISFDAGRIAAHWHQVLFTGLEILVALHLAAVAFYLLVRRDNLIGPMITGFKRRAKGPEAEEPSPPFWRLAVGVLAAGGLAYGLSRGFR